jgi:hypothetical protein
MAAWLEEQMPALVREAIATGSTEIVFFFGNCAGRARGRVPNPARFRLSSPHWGRDE